MVSVCLVNTMKDCGTDMNEKLNQLWQKAEKEIEKENLEGVYKNSVQDRFSQFVLAGCLHSCKSVNDIEYLANATRQQVVLHCVREIENTFRS